MKRTQRQLILPASDSCDLLNHTSPEQVVATIRSAQRSNVDLYGRVSSPQFDHTDMWQTETTTADGRPLIVVVQTIAQLIHLEAREGKKARRALTRIMAEVVRREVIEAEKKKGRSLVGMPFKDALSKKIQKYGSVYGGE